MKYFFSNALLLLGLLLVGNAFADQANPLLYTRSSVGIVRHNPPAALPWQGSHAPAETPALTFNVEMRDAMVLYNQKGWYNLSSPDEHSGVMMVFSAPGISPIERSAQYAPLDILMIDKEGRIVQIVPNITLSKLDREILPPSPVLAFLFLKGGLCQSLSINPGDIVENKLFVPPPLVLSAPPAAAAAPAVPAPPAAVVPAAPKTAAPPPEQPAPHTPNVSISPAKHAPLMDFQQIE